MERCRKNNPECPFRLSKAGCRLVSHHLFWPESWYRDNPTETEFRELPENRVPMCEFEEKTLHAETDPPPKPSFEVMGRVVEMQRERRRLAGRILRKP